MDCKLCQQLPEAYREGMLSPDLKTQVDAHLEACRSCSMIYRDYVLSERVIRKEKEGLIIGFDSPSHITVPISKTYLDVFIRKLSDLTAPDDK